MPASALLKIVKMTLLIIIILITLAILYFRYSLVFGDTTSRESIQAIANSPNYNGGRFQNLVITNMNFKKGNDYNNEYIVNKTIGKRPKKPLPTKYFDKSIFANNEKNSIVWLGHSTILIKIENKTILTDPVFNKASPFPLLGPKPFNYENKLNLNDLPDNIDIMLITHDHYDHLDYKTMKSIHPQVDKFLVPLGVKAHLLKWGVPNTKIEEFDWYDNTSFLGINFTFTPSRHFSGRKLKDRFATLWGGWIIKSKNSNIYISGDGGYSDEFKKIGDKFGPFDLMFVENGAYNPRWENIHLFPEQGVLASIEARAKVAFPIHWGKFSLSSHSWSEPIIRFTTEAAKKELLVAIPLIGQIILLGEQLPTDRWWENY